MSIKLTHQEIDKRVREAMKPVANQTTQPFLNRLLAIAKTRKQKTTPPVEET